MGGYTASATADASPEGGTLAAATIAHVSPSFWLHRLHAVSADRSLYHVGAACRKMWGLGHSSQLAAPAAGPQHVRSYAVGGGGGAWAKGRRTKMAAIRNKDGAADTGPQLRVNEDITAPVVRLVLEDDTHQVTERDA